jgi:hypothetical protein
MYGVQRSWCLLFFLQPIAMSTMCGWHIHGVATDHMSDVSGQSLFDKEWGECMHDMSSGVSVGGESNHVHCLSCLEFNHEPLYALFAARMLSAVRSHFVVRGFESVRTEWMSGLQ